MMLSVLVSHITFKIAQRKNKSANQQCFIEYLYFTSELSTDSTDFSTIYVKLWWQKDSDNLFQKINYLYLVCLFLINLKQIKKF